MLDLRWTTCPDALFTPRIQSAAAFTTSYLCNCLGFNGSYWCQYCTPVSFQNDLELSRQKYGFWSQNFFGNSISCHLLSQFYKNMFGCKRYMTLLAKECWWMMRIRLQNYKKDGDVVGDDWKINDCLTIWQHVCLGSSLGWNRIQCLIVPRETADSWVN